MQAVNFTVNDLVSNRMGQVTDRQVQSLKRRAWAVAGRTAVVGLVFGVVLLAAGLTVNDRDHQHRRRGPVDPRRRAGLCGPLQTRGGD
jgi:hypothetical protein